MTIKYHRQFLKQIHKLPQPIQRKLAQRLQLFTDNPTDRTLRVHELRGRYEGYLSIDVTGDVRAIYHPLDRDSVEFVRVGTHSQLYR